MVAAAELLNPPEASKGRALAGAPTVFLVSLWLCTERLQVAA